MIAAIFFAVSFLKDHVMPEWLRSIAQEAVVALEEVKLILSLLAKHQRVVFFLAIVSYTLQSARLKIHPLEWLNRCFCESSLRNYKKSSPLRFTQIHMFSCFWKSRKSTCL